LYLATHDSIDGGIDSTARSLGTEKDPTHSSQQVRFKGGGTPFRSKKRPPTISSKNLLSKKITKNIRKIVKIAKKPPQKVDKSA
jgi:hypothetical protein